MDVRVESGDLTGDSGSESIQLVAVPDSERSEFGKMVTLQPVRSSWVDGAKSLFSGKSERLPLRLRCPILENRTRMVLPARRTR